MNVLELDGRKLFMSGQFLMQLNAHEASILSLLNDSDMAVSRKELLAAGWPNTIVSENSVNMAIRSIRSSTGLKDIIITEQGVGYSFNHEVYLLSVISNASKKDAETLDLPQSSFNSAVEAESVIKSGGVDFYDVISLLLGVVFGLFFYFKTGSEYCETFDAVKVCSVEVKDLETAKDLILLENGNKGGVYYYGRLNAYKEYAVVEVK